MEAQDPDAGAPVDASSDVDDADACVCDADASSDADVAVCICLCGDAGVEPEVDPGNPVDPRSTSTTQKVLIKELYTQSEGLNEQLSDILKRVEQVKRKRKAKKKKEYAAPHN